MTKHSTILGIFLADLSRGFFTRINVRHFESEKRPGDEVGTPPQSNVRDVFSFYLVGFYLTLSGNMEKDV